MLPDEFTARLSSKQLTELAAFDRIAPSGNFEILFMLAQICQILHAANIEGPPPNLAEFFYKVETPEEKDNNKNDASKLLIAALKGKQ